MEGGRTARLPPALVVVVAAAAVCLLLDGLGDFGEGALGGRRRGDLERGGGSGLWCCRVVVLWSLDRLRRGRWYVFFGVACSAGQHQTSPYVILFIIYLGGGLGRCGSLVMVVMDAGKRFIVSVAVSKRKGLVGRAAACCSIKQNKNKQKKRKIGACIIRTGLGRSGGGSLLGGSADLHAGGLFGGGGWRIGAKGLEGGEINKTIDLGVGVGGLGDRRWPVFSGPGKATTHSTGQHSTAQHSIGSSFSQVQTNVDIPRSLIYFTFVAEPLLAGAERGPVAGLEATTFLAAGAAACFVCAL
jgi:hypothetical protein